MKERPLFLHGFSKAWPMTGFRIGYACAPAPLIEAMMKIHQYTMLCSPILSQEAALEALKKPESDIQEMKAHYHRHRNYMTQAFKTMNLPCSNPEGAFYAFPKIDHLNISSMDFALQLLDQQDVAVVPGTAFGPSGEGHIRCCFATSLDKIKIAMDRIAQFTASLE